MKWIAGRPVLFALALAAGGCGIGGPPELRPEAFVNPAHPGMEPGVIAKPVDQNGTVVYGDLHAPILPEEYPNRHPNVPMHIPSVVRNQITASQPAGGADIPAAATASTTAPAGPLPDTAEVVGTVVEIVNGTPIYADKVVSSIQPALAADARRLDVGQFRQAAYLKIVDRVSAMEADLVQVAAANAALSSEDKLQADAAATVIRNQLIAAAGGSVEMAKERARENGTTFDEQVKQERDLQLVRLYYTRFVIPQIQVSADDMRNYYQQNLATKFSKAAAARFRVIKIDIQRSGGMDRAVQKANDILRQLKGGADFAKLAGQYNDLSSLMRSGGDVGWVQKGSFFSDEVEKAVWNLHPGEITDTPIEDRNPADPAFYLAKLEAIQPGAVQPFDSDEVQETIRNTLADAQFRALKTKRIQQLEQEAVRMPIPHGLDSALDIAMQRYPAWAAAR